MSQLELNYIPIASDARARDQQDLMSFPCFSLSKRKRMDIIKFEDGKGNFIEVSPNPKFGMATVWDFDIMLYFVSYIRHLMDTDQKIPRVFNVHAYDILKFCNRSTGKSQYEQLRKGMQRLSSTYISTNIREDTIEEEEIERKETYLNFTWIAAFKENVTTRINPKTGKQREIARAYEIQLPQWFIDGVVNSKLVLGINPAYFELTGGLERWLYRIARKFSGLNPNGIKYTLKHLYERSGSKSSYRKFKQNLKQTIEKGDIPDYHFGLFEMSGKDWVHISKKNNEPVSDKEKLDAKFEEFKSFKLIAESPR